MKLRTKLPLFTSITVFVSIVIIATFSIIEFRREIEKSIEVYREEETEQILNHLKDVVNISYSMIDNSYRASTKEAIEERYGLKFNEEADQTVRMIAINMLKITIENLRVLRFGVDGYIWINEFEKPYTVVMHPIKPELEGKDWVFYIEDTDINVYDAFHDSIVAGEGAGRVQYNFYKPGSNERIPKLSWVRLYEPQGWVIGTGVYIDHIDKMVAKKTAELQAQIRRLILWISLIGALLIFVASLGLFFFGKTITSPLYQIQTQLSVMAQGKMVQHLKMDRKDEIGQMKHSLDALINGFTTYSKFAIEIGKGNFESDFKLLSNEDILGNSLIQMRKSLIKARHEEEIRQEENKKRQWATEGLTIFGNIIRANSDNMETLADKFLLKLTQYVNANQGGIFILNNHNSDDKHLYQIATIAYDRKKHQKKRLELDEGLIGACFLEKDKIYITKLPQDYMEIRSGLGTANPDNLLLVPLKYEEIVYGVIELAAFNKFEKHEIDFVEKVSESLAVSISTSHLNQ